jgi:putative glutamine amidotransferase
MVNSLHWQGVDRLGEGLAVEAVAEDGTVEALRVEAARAFALAVQWHPEHRFDENPVSRAIFGAFADAIEGRQRHLSVAAA